MKLFTYLALVVSLFVSCKEVVDIDFEENKNMYVYAYINDTSEFVTIYVGESSSILGEVTDPSVNSITDASVKLSSENITIEIAFDELEQAYKADLKNMPPEPGRSYILDVYTQTYGAAQATTTLPIITNEIELKVTEIQFQKYGDEYGDPYNYFYLQYTFNDFSNTGKYITNQENDQDLIYGDYNDVTKNSSLTGTYNGYYFTDEVNKAHTIYPRINVIDPVTYNFFQKTMYNSESNPFVEPVIVKGNFDNCLGLFGSYLTIEKELTITLD